MMDRRFTLWAAAGAVLPTMILIVMTLIKTGGVWEYALDDVYIHLAMSDQLWNGGYGVNAGEYASASSSILYSYLLAPVSPFRFSCDMAVGSGSCRVDWQCDPLGACYGVCSRGFEHGYVLDVGRSGSFGTVVHGVAEHGPDRDGAYAACLGHADGFARPFGVCQERADWVAVDRRHRVESIAAL